MGASGYSRDSWIEVDLNHITENIHSFQNYLHDKQIMAVVKGNAYGHGAVQVAHTALNAGASWLGVALLDEALELRHAGIEAPILVFGWVHPEDAWRAAEQHISLTVFQTEWIEKAKNNLNGDHPLKAHVKIDTGMGRIGARGKEELYNVVSGIDEAPCFQLEGVYTHFATADERDSSYFKMQYERFCSMLSWISGWGFHPEIIHCANSATALNHPDKVFDLVRLGISMYGLTPAEEMNATIPFPLKQAFNLHSRLIHIKQIDPGEGVSYGAIHIAQEKEWIGTVPLGYADGWARKLAESGQVLVNGNRVPIIGKICMDFFMVKLPKNMEIGTKVTLIGEQNNGWISVDEVADQLGTISYEVPCMISERVPKIYESAKVAT